MTDERCKKEEKQDCLSSFTFVTFCHLLRTVRSLRFDQNGWETDLYPHFGLNNRWVLRVCCAEDDIPYTTIQGSILYMAGHSGFFALSL